MHIRRLLRVCRQRLRSLVHPAQLDSELDRELAFHLQQLTQEHRARGLSAEDARRAALREFGNPALMAERSRDQRRVRWAHDLPQDLLYGLRMLRRSPGFTAVAVASLALGIGASAAVLSTLHAALVQALPFRDPGRLVIIRTYPLDNPAQVGGASALEFLAWKDRTTTFETIGASLSGPRHFDAEPNGPPAESVPCQAFTAELFPTLGVQPAHGHLFEPMDPLSASAEVAVISHRLWQQRYAGADLLGRRVRVNGTSTRLVGVMPLDFRFQGETVDCWVPLILGRGAARQLSTGRPLGLTGRLKRGVTVEHAQADLQAILAQLATEPHGRANARGVRVQPLREVMYGWLKPPLFTLQAAATLVLILACFNVAGLLLARGTVRGREIALRVALGAGSGRIVRQLLTESVLVAAAGGALGLLVAWLGLAALTTTLGPPPGAPRLAEVGLDLRLLTLTIVLSAGSVLAFGLAPALAGARLDLTGTLSASGPSTGAHPGGPRQRSVLVAVQIALALVLLIGAGLLSKSFVRLTTRDINIDPQGLLTFEYHSMLPDERTTAPRSVPSEAIARLHDRLRRLPTVVSAGATSYPPVNSLVLPTALVTPIGKAVAGQRVACFLVTPDVFTAMRTPIVRGREVNDHDTLGAPWVAVVNEALAARLWPGEDPIGRQVILDGSDERSRDVIGIVGDIPTRFNQTAPEPVVYTSYLQRPAGATARWMGMFGQMTFIVRHSGDPAVVLDAARRAAADLDRDRAIVSVGTVERHLFGRLQERRNFVVALAVFALVATLLAAIGIYGVTDYAVRQRTREIGVRRALGANSREIVALVGRRVLVLMAAGLAGGVLIALALTRWIAAQLWGVTPTDAPTYAGVSLLLASVALLASFVPTRRAIAVDPTVVLRCE